MSDYERIYLQPECCADPDVGRLWCQDDEPETCPDGEKWTPYVLASEVTRLQSEVERLRGRCGEMEDECRNAQKYMVWLSGGKEVPTVRAWLLRKQAEALEACADGLPKSHATFVRLHNEAQRLRQQADEAEKAGS